MLGVGQLFASKPVADALFFGDGERPVYARLPDGSLRQLDAVSAARIITTAGPHDVIVLAVSEATATEEEAP